MKTVCGLDVHKDKMFLFIVVCFARKTDLQYICFAR